MIPFNLSLIGTFLNHTRVVQTPNCVTGCVKQLQCNATIVVELRDNCYVVKLRINSV